MTIRLSAFLNQESVEHFNGRSLARFFAADTEGLENQPHQVA
jgi:hypothetical protein